MSNADIAVHFVNENQDKISKQQIIRLFSLMKDGNSYKSRNSLSQGSKKISLQDSEEIVGKFDVVVETVDVNKMVITPSGEVYEASLEISSSNNV